jgi:hypothetical protein
MTEELLAFALGAAVPLLAALVVGAVCIAVAWEKLNG